MFFILKKKFFLKVFKKLINDGKGVPEPYSLNNGF